MNRDEKEAETQNQSRSGTELAREIAMGALPAEILSAGDAPPAATYILDVQSAVDKAVSKATSSKRVWDRKTLHLACRAARPAVEQEMRQAGKAFTGDELRAQIRLRVKGYVDRYAVTLPTGTILGGTTLEAVAADICGAFALPWTAFVPPQVQIAMAATKAGKPQAVSWLRRIFGGGKKAEAPKPQIAEASKAAPAPAAVTPATAAATGSSDSLGDDELGAWLHKMNPLYWLKSAQERKFIDAERQAWIDNAYNVKQQQKKEKVMTQAQKALTAKQASATAYQHTAELESQLKSIESQITGAIGPAEILGKDSSFVGKAEIMGKEAPVEDPFASKIPEEAAAPVVKKIQKARKLNEANRQDLEAICTKLKAGEGLSPENSSKLLILLARNEQLHSFRKALVSGEIYAQNPARAQIQRQTVLGAVKALTPTEQQQLAQMLKLAKSGNPNAIKAVALLRSQGYAVMGSFFSDAWSLATKPITVPLKYLGKGAKWTGQKLGIIKKGSASPEQVRLDRLRAVQKRVAAARARARAADAQSEAEYRAQQQIAAAADAEADAADAEATAKEAAMMTAETEAAPGFNPEADQSGLPPAPPPSAAILNAPYSYYGVKPVITSLPPTPSPGTAKVAAVKKAIIAKKHPKAAKIIAKAEEDSPGGIKLRASMKLYKGAKANPKGPEAKAIRTMAAKARAGDKQALADIHAVKLAQAAVKADQKAGKQTARLFAAQARKKKVAAVQKNMEIAASNVLIRRSRTRQLAKVAKLERKAAAGDPKAVAIVKNQVAKAKKGDPKAKTVCKGLALAKHVRTTAPTRRERKNLVAAHKLVAKVSKGDKKAIAQARVIRAAAAHGNPNAQRAKKRMQTAAAVHIAITTGAIVLPATIATKERQDKKRQQNQQKIAFAEKKLDKGTASREELQAGAKAAADNGDKAKAAELLVASNEAPSKSEVLKKSATVLAAAANDNPKAQASIAKAQDLASKGDPLGMEAMGNVVAVKNLDQIAKGKPMDPEMADAVKLTQAAAEGDAKAAETLQQNLAKAKTGDGKAVKATVLAAGAVAVSKSLAANPTAQSEWLAKAGVKPDVEVEKQDTIIRQPAGPHPFSSLGRDALPPIRGLWQLLTESMRAILLATPDPTSNYRQGIAARSQVHRLAAISAAGDEAPGKRPIYRDLDDDEPTPPKGPGKPGKPGKPDRPKKDPEAKYMVHAKPDPEAQYRVHGEDRVAKLRERIAQLRKKQNPTTDDQRELERAAEQLARAEAMSGTVGKEREIVNDSKEAIDELAKQTKNPEMQKYILAIKDQPPNSAERQGRMLYAVESVQAEKIAAKAPALAGDAVGEPTWSWEINEPVPTTKSKGDDAGAALPDEHKKLADATKARLAKLKDAAGKGDKAAAAKWEIAKKNYAKAKEKAQKGDAKAQALLAILDATKLF
jgi:hypothetical protein